MRAPRVVGSSCPNQCCFSDSSLIPKILCKSVAAVHFVTFNKHRQSRSQIEEAIGKEPNSMTCCAGKTLAENLQDVPDLKEGQMLIYPIDRPIKASGHIQIMYGNLAPEGCVGKITGKEGLEFEGPARVFDSEELMLKAVEAGPQQLKVSCVSIPKTCSPVNFESCMWALQNFAPTMAESFAMSALNVFKF